MPESISFYILDWLLLMIKVLTLMQKSADPFPPSEGIFHLSCVILGFLCVYIITLFKFCYILRLATTTPTHLPKVRPLKAEIVCFVQGDFTIE